MTYRLTDFYIFDANNVFFNKLALVIGPTPPGTGVMNEHLDDT